MAKPIDASWADDPVSDANLNLTTYGQGTSFPATWPTTRLFWRTDTNKLYKNTGTEGTPVWIELIPTSQALDQLYSLSTTIGDYSIPSSASGTGITDDFSSYADQPSADAAWPTTDTAKDRVNITNDNLDFNHNVASTNIGISHDYTSVSNTAWRIRFKLRFSALVQNTNAFMSITFDSLTHTSDHTVSRDFIGMQIRNISGSTWYSTIDADGAGKNQTADNTTNLTWATSTDYFFEIERTSSTAYIIRRYSDSTYTSVSDTCSGTCASTNVGLRYFVIQSYNLTLTGTFTGTIDDVTIFGDEGAVKDDNVGTTWTSPTANNPFLYIDTGSAQEVIGLAIHLNRTLTTETQIKIRYSTDTAFTDGETIRLINISDFTDDTWRFISLPRQADDRRYVQIYGVSNSVVLSINEIKYRVKTTAIMNREHFHFYLNPTSATATQKDSN